MEIERKYLVDPEKFKSFGVSSIFDRITQGYISTGTPVVRIRYYGSEKNPRKAWITFKGKGLLVRDEYEFEVPEHQIKDAVALLNSYCVAPVIRKNRYKLYFNGKLWEVDEFLDGLNGLWIAEIELKSVDEKFVKPDWVTTEVTEDARYSNANLAMSGVIPK